MSWYESALQNAKGEARHSSPDSSRSKSRPARPDRPLAAAQGLGLHVRELVGALLWRSWFLLLWARVGGQKKQGATREGGVAAAPYKLGLIQPSFLAVYQTLAFFPILILTRTLTLTAWNSLEAKTWVNFDVFHSSSSLQSTPPHFPCTPGPSRRAIWFIRRWDCFLTRPREMEHILPIPCLPSGNKASWDQWYLLFLIIKVQMFGKSVFVGWRERCLEAKNLWKQKGKQFWVLWFHLPKSRTLVIRRRAGTGSSCPWKTCTAH